MIHALLLAIAAGPGSLHVRVDGPGFMRFARGGKLLYGAEVTLNVHDGILMTLDGAVMIPRIHVPADSSKLTINHQGKVFSFSGATKKEVGQVILAMLPSTMATDRLFSTSQAGNLLNPGEEEAGVLQCSSTGGTAVSDRTPPAASPTKEPAQTTQIRVEVRTSSEIDADETLLGDVAKITGPKDLVSDISALDLGRAPLFGASSPLSPGYISAKLRSIGLKPSDFELEVPKGATVTRAGQVITIDQMLEAANTAIKEKYDVAVPLKPDAKVYDLKTPKGDVSLRGEIGQISERAISVTVVAEIDGRRVGTRSMVLIPTDDQIGVKAGDAVTIRLISAGATVEVTGTVKNSGFVGQTVSVTSVTGSKHTGKVISSNVVEVRL